MPKLIQVDPLQQGWSPAEPQAPPCEEQQSAAAPQTPVVEFAAREQQLLVQSESEVHACWHTA